MWYGTTGRSGEMNAGTIYRLRLTSPRFTGITRDTNGCHLTFQGLQNFRYEWQASEKLAPASWETLDTFDATTTGGLEVLDDEDAPQGTNRFYRVRWVPELLP